MPVAVTGPASFRMGTLSRPRGARWTVTVVPPASNVNDFPSAATSVTGPVTRTQRSLNRASAAFASARYAAARSAAVTATGSTTGGPNAGPMRTVSKNAAAVARNAAGLARSPDPVTVMRTPARSPTTSRTAVSRPPSRAAITTSRPACPSCVAARWWTASPFTFVANRTRATLACLSHAAGLTSWSPPFSPSSTATAYSVPAAVAVVTRSPIFNMLMSGSVTVTVVGGLGNRAVNTPPGSAKSVGSERVKTK